MKNRFPLFLGGMALFLESCAVPVQEERHSMPTEYVLSRSEAIRTDRQDSVGSDIRIVTGFGNLALSDSHSHSFRLSFVAEAPVLETGPLKLLQMTQQGSTLIVAYQSTDGSPRGALSLFDVSDPARPQLRSRLQLPHLNLQKLALEGQAIYFVGYSSDPSGPVIGRVTWIDSELQADLELEVLDAKNLEDLVVLEDRVIVVDREASTLSTLQKKDFLTMGQANFEGVDSLIRDESGLWALGIGPTRLTRLDANLTKLNGVVDLSELTDRKVSSQLQVGQEILLASLGANGVTGFCKSDQKPLFKIPAVIRGDLPLSMTASRAAVMSRGLLLTANAEAGVYVYSVKTRQRDGICKARDLRLEGSLDLGKTFRAELLSLKNGVLAVGDGKNRVNFIQVEGAERVNDDQDFDLGPAKT